MKIIAAVDDRMGMAFNHRRVSRDSKMIDDIRSLTEGENLYVSPYSEALFDPQYVTASDNYLTLADENPDGWAFCELESPKEFEDSIDTIVLYLWNRAYPADVHFDLDLDKYRLIEVSEFEGSTHEMERRIYEKTA